MNQTIFFPELFAYDWDRYWYETWTSWLFFVIVLFTICILYYIIYKTISCYKCLKRRKEFERDIEKQVTYAYSGAGRLPCKEPIDSPREGKEIIAIDNLVQI